VHLYLIDTKKVKQDTFYKSQGVFDASEEDAAKEGELLSEFELLLNDLRLGLKSVSFVLNFVN